MSGHLEQRGRSWRLIVNAGHDPVTGKRRQIKETIPPGADGKPIGRRAAQTRLNELIADHAGRSTDRSQATFGELLDAYLAARTRMSIGTREANQGYIDRNISDHLKRTPIGKIGPYELDALYRHLEAEGGTCSLKEKCVKLPCDHGGGKPLAPVSVVRVHAIISAAFAQAVKWGWLRESPAARATPPSVVKAEVVPPDVEQVVAFLTYVDALDKDENLLPDFVTLTLATGARPAELCALPWPNVDLQRGRVTIRQAFTRGGGGQIKGTKTNKVRRVRLDAEAVEMLRRRWQGAAQHALDGGVPLEDAWVFPSTKDVTKPVWPTTVGASFREARTKVGAGDELTLRNLRHFVASVLLANGQDVVTVAKRLGHSPDVLLKVYAHLIDEADDVAAAVVPEVVRQLRDMRSR